MRGRQLLRSPCADEYLTSIFRPRPLPTVAQLTGFSFMTGAEIFVDGGVRQI